MGAVPLLPLPDALEAAHRGADDNDEQRAHRLGSAALPVVEALVHLRGEGSHSCRVSRRGLHLGLRLLDLLLDLDLVLRRRVLSDLSGQKTTHVAFDDRRGGTPLQTRGFRCCRRCCRWTRRRLRRRAGLLPLLSAGREGREAPQIDHAAAALAHSAPVLPVPRKSGWAAVLCQQKRTPQ